MSLAQFLADLEAFRDEATRAFGDAGDADAIEKARIEFLGVAKGRLKAIQKGLGAVPKVDKPTAGKRFNEIKSEVERAFEEKKMKLLDGLSYLTTQTVVAGGDLKNAG